MSVFFSFLFSSILLLFLLPVRRWRSSLGNRHALRTSNIMHFSIFFSALSFSPSRFIFFFFIRTMQQHTRPSPLLLSCTLLGLLLLFYYYAHFFPLPFLFCSLSIACMLHFLFACQQHCLSLLYHLYHRLNTIFSLFILSKKEKKTEKNSKNNKDDSRYCCLVFLNHSFSVIVEIFKCNTIITISAQKPRCVWGFPGGYFKPFYIHEIQIIKIIFSNFISPKIEKFINIQVAGEYWWRWWWCRRCRWRHIVTLKCCCILCYSMFELEMNQLAKIIVFQIR